VKRIAALLGKEFTDLRLNPAVFLPAAIAGLFSLILPFVIAVVIPYVSGEPLADSSDFDVAVEMYRQQPRTRSLDPEGAIQAWLFQQFLMFLIIIPVVGSTSVAGHSVVGEKHARTLEPLLATPITTFELLAAKTLAALLPAFALSLICFGVYLAGIAALARPGVVWALLEPRSLTIVFALGLLAVLAALQVAVCVSSRVDDERSAQQWGSLIVLPIAAMFVAPILGSEITLPMIGGVIAGLIVFNAVLMRIGISVFDRESILTRWK
jgi:ABC-2 type transport system permease protein